MHTMPLAHYAVCSRHMRGSFLKISMVSLLIRSALLELNFPGWKGPLKPLMTNATIRESVTFLQVPSRSVNLGGVFL
ncbi:hypothetical protein HanIR_Chr03g0128191 [Helianthus annuus]|nr:hypothetical protein HanIR_Chr03g0128191 [Helianthus annuus]